MEYISINHLTKKFGNISVLNNITFDINHPGIVGIVGPNGAGKTTMFRIITNLIKHYEGDVKVFGRKTSVINARRIVYCTDADGMYEDLSGRENIEFISNCYNVENASEKIASLVKMFGIDNDVDKVTNHMSKGTKKKIALIRALIIDADIYIFDEPLSFLDYETQLTFLKLIREIGQKKLVLLSNHNLMQIERVSDYVIILNKEVKFFGSVKEIDTGFVIKLKIEIDDLETSEKYDMLLQSIRSIKGVLEASVNNNIIEIEYDKRVSGIEGLVFNVFFNNYKMTIKSINHIEKNLEELYYKKINE